MGIVVVLILVIIVVFTVVILRGKNNTPGPIPSGEGGETYQQMLEASTATKSSSILDPDVKELNRSGTASKGSSTRGGDREALLRESTVN